MVMTLPSMSGRGPGLANGAAGILCGPTASSVGHTSGSARTHPRRGMARQRRHKQSAPSCAQNRLLKTLRERFVLDGVEVADRPQRCRGDEVDLIKLAHV